MVTRGDSWLLVVTRAIYLIIAISARLLINKHILNTYKKKLCLFNCDVFHDKAIFNEYISH